MRLRIFTERQQGATYDQLLGVATTVCSAARCSPSSDQTAYERSKLIW